MAPAFDELLKENAKLKKKIEELKGIIDANHLADATTDQKDRLFRFMFGNPSNREWTLELYNALNGSHYEDASAIDFNTIGDVLYVGMKNDVSFIISAQMVMWEHQPEFPGVMLTTNVASNLLGAAYVYGTRGLPIT